MHAGLPDDPVEAARRLLRVTAGASPSSIEDAYRQRLAELRQAFIDLGGFPRDPSQAALRFDNFVVGESNRDAFQLARRVAVGPHPSCNPLFIHGGCGLGKTHLLQAIGNEVVEHRRQLVLCCSAQTFVEEMIDSVARNRLQEFRDKYRQLQYLLLDNVQMLGGKSRAQEEAYAILDHLVACGAQVVLAGRDMPTSQQLGPGLRSRMRQSVPVEIRFPELPEREEIVARKAEGLGLNLSRPLVYCLARQPVADVRDIESAVRRLHTHYRQGGLLTTPEQLEAVLYGGTVAPAPSGTPTTIDDIQEVVSRHFNLAVGELVVGRGSLRVKRARQIALYLSKELCCAGIDEIRRSFHAEHSQLTYAQRKIKNGLSDPLLSEDLRGIRQELLELSSRRP